jgi:hypothetical protein
MVLGRKKSIIPVLLVTPESYRERAHRMLRHCEELGTYVWWVEIPQAEEDAFVTQYPTNRYHCIQANALHRAACVAHGRAFIYIECDSIPLKKGWEKALAEEYARCGSKFLLSSDSQLHDQVGGIGVYPPETEWLVPIHYPKSSWDLWLIECLPHLVARTPLIQHSYGFYNNEGFVREVHRFPRDQAMLRSEAVIFHRDPHQDLIQAAPSSALSRVTG